MINPTNSPNTSDRLLSIAGMMIVAPVLIIMGSLAMFMLATPVLMAAVVVSFAMVVLILVLGTAVTRTTQESAGKETTTGEAAMCETVDLIPNMKPGTMKPGTMKTGTLRSGTLESETIEMVDVLVAAPIEKIAASITKVTGPCPLGRMPGNTWRIGPDGTLPGPMCRPGGDFHRADAD